MADAGGLLINGLLIPVDGVNVLRPDQETWVHLTSGDCIPRSNWPQMAILHKTIADDPEHTLPGSGPAAGHGGAEYTAEYWAQDPQHSGAHLVTGFNGDTGCLEDLVKMCAWHANQANQLSYGHEMKEVVKGGCYQATYDAAFHVTLEATRVIGIQWQCPHAYAGKPLARMADGGKSLVGIFGHRDVTNDRGRWDPGDLIFAMLANAGVERFDFNAHQDIDVWQSRQTWLRDLGLYHGPLDGIPGPGTTAALKSLGYPDGIFGAWRAAPVRPPLPPGYVTG